jgi:hypothetical protein
MQKLKKIAKIFYFQRLVSKAILGFKSTAAQQQKEYHACV